MIPRAPGGRSLRYVSEIWGVGGPGSKFKTFNHVLMVDDTDHPLTGVLLDAVVGSTVELCLEEAIRVAEFFSDRPVTLRVEGVLIPVCPGGTVEVMAKFFHDRPCPYETWSGYTADRLVWETHQRTAAHAFYMAGLLRMTAADRVSAFAARVLNKVADTYESEAGVAAIKAAAAKHEMDGWSPKLPADTQA